MLKLGFFSKKMNFYQRITAIWKRISYFYWAHEIWEAWSLDPLAMLRGERHCSIILSPVVVFRLLEKHIDIKNVLKKRALKVDQQKKNEVG